MKLFTTFLGTETNTFSPIPPAMPISPRRFWCVAGITEMSRPYIPDHWRLLESGHNNVAGQSQRVSPLSPSPLA